MKLLVKVFFTLSLIFSIDTFAENIDWKRLTIKGVALGDDLSKINPPCQDSILDSIDFVKKGGISVLHKHNMYCGNNVRVQLTRDNKVFIINRKISFDIKPNWNKIRKDIINQYGQPTSQTLSKKIKIDNGGIRWDHIYDFDDMNPNVDDSIGWIQKMCWGICSSGNVISLDGDFALAYNRSTKNKYFEIELINTSSYYSAPDLSYSLEFNARDYQVGSDNYQQATQELARLLKEKSKEQSNIDF